MSGVLRQTLPHVKKRLTNALNTSISREANISVHDKTDKEAVKEALLLANSQQISDNLQIKEALRALKELDASWLEIISGITNATQKTEEERHYNKARFGEDGPDKVAGYEELFHSAETQMVQIVANRQLLESKYQSLLPATLAPPAPSVVTEVTLPPTGVPPLTIATPTLESLPLPEFNGDIRQWNYFWEQFSVIDKHPLLTNSYRLQYLKKQLKGKAASHVKNLPQSDANYDVAVKLLKDKYGGKEKFIATLYQDLINLSPKTATKDCRKLFDDCESTLQQLKAAGENITTQHVFIQWRDKFPPDIMKQAILAVGNNTSDFDAIRKELDRIIDVTDAFTKDIPNEPNKKFNNTSSSKVYSVTSQNNAQNQSSKSKNFKCKLCELPHLTFKCRTYKTSKERWDAVKAKHKCYCCLNQFGKGHECKNKEKCRYCDKIHNPCLCINNPIFKEMENLNKRRKNATVNSVEADVVDNNSHDEQKPKLDVHSIAISLQHPVSPTAGMFPKQQQSDVVEKMTIADEKSFDEKIDDTTIASVGEMKKEILLPTKVIKIMKKGKNEHEAPTFFDNGSQQSFILNSVAEKLKLTCLRKRSIWIRRFQETNARKKTCNEYEFHVKLLDGKDMAISALGVDDIVSEISFVIDPKEFKFQNALPEILIGSDFYWEFYPCQKTDEGLRYVETSVGKIYCGPVPESNATMINSLVCSVKDIVAENDQNLTVKCDYFFSVEHPFGVYANPNETDAEAALRHFNETVQFMMNRYWVKWPFKIDNPELPLNYNFCLKHLEKLVKRLSDQNLLIPYDNVFKEYLKNGKIEICKDGIRPADLTKLVHYLIHRAVLKDSLTTPIRPVYNCSFKASKNSNSFNQLLYTGPNLIPRMLGILLRFREYIIVCIGDIEKAFYQLYLQMSDRDVVRFLWLIDVTKGFSKDNILICRLCCPIFGAGASPFMLMASLFNLFSKFNTPLSLELKKNAFVDNMSWGGNTSAEVINKTEEAKDIFKHASMNLRELLSNDADVNASQNVTPKPVKFLGINWNPLTDQISIECGISKLNSTDEITKRNVLSFIASLFDPMGLISPVIISFKIFFQELWRLKLSWDEKIPEDLLIKWRQLLAINAQQKITVDRKVIIADAMKSDLHVFCDSSKKAMGAVAYIRQTTATGEIFVNLLVAKTRVAPLKETTIPRLELLSTVLGAELIKLLVQEMTTKFDDIYLHTDSSCVLEWLHQKGPFPKFLAKCIEKVQAVVKNIHHIRTHENPADLNSRGISLPELVNNDLWWFGPSWLKLDVKNWPSPAVVPHKKEFHNYDDAELITTEVNNILIGAENFIKFIDELKIEKFASWRKLLMTVKSIFYFIQKAPINQTLLKKFDHFDNIKNYLVKIEKMAEYVLLLGIQAKYTPDENIKRMLNIRKDNHGLLRCFHRLENVHPTGLIYLPHCYPAKLIVLYYHKILIHAGPKHILNELRRKFWLPAGRSYIQSCIYEYCLVCRKNTAKPFKLPLMPALPESRVTYERPFQNIAIDYTGHFFVKAANIDTKEKCWIVLICCMSTRAIYLDMTYCMDSANFLNLFRRFVARKGKPENVLSDNGTNMKAAQPVICYKWLKAEAGTALRRYLNDNGIQWDFITERSPWMGGVYERLIGLVKTKLKFVIGRRILSNDVFSTLLAEIETVINSRPITPVENKWRNLNMIALRPLDFISPAANHEAAHFESEDENDPDYLLKDSTQTNLLKLWKKTTFLLDKFRQQFKLEYLNMLRETAAHAHKQKGIDREPYIGEVVLIADENADRKDWKLGVIIETHKSADGNIRSATVKTPSGNALKRPINSLLPLEIKAAEIPTLKTKADKQAVSENVVEKRVLRPRKTANVVTLTANEEQADKKNFKRKTIQARTPSKLLFYLLTIAIFIPIIDANPCSTHIIQGRFPEYAESCKHEGLLVFKMDNEFCWKKFSCGNDYIRLRDEGNGTYCGPPCTCPAWSDGCSFYKGPALKNSTIKNNDVDNLIKLARPDENRAYVFQIQLADDSKHFVSDLNLHHHEIHPNAFECIGDGNLTTGTPYFCAHHECIPNANKFCYYQHHETVYWLADNNGRSKIPITAWGLIERQFPEKKIQPHDKAELKCTAGTIYVKSDDTISLIEVESGRHYYAEDVKNSTFDVIVPNALAVAARIYEIKLLYHDQQQEVQNVFCEAIDYCNRISCWFCIDELLNPSCHPMKIVLFSLIILLILWIVIGFCIGICLCRRRYRRRRMPSFSRREGATGWWRFRKRRTSDPPLPRNIPDRDEQNDGELQGVIVRLPMSPLTTLYIVALAVLPMVAYACSNAIAITATSNSCEANAYGWTSCTFEQATELFMPSSSEICLLLKNNDDVPFGNLKIIATTRSTCIPTVKHYTRISEITSPSIKRCPGMGQCFGTNCAHIISTDRIEGIGQANNLPGNSGCVESAGGIFAGCGGFSEACTFFRYFATPIVEDVIKVQKCEDWRTEVVLNVTLIGQGKPKENHIIVLAEGEQVVIGQISYALLMLHQKPIPLDVHVIDNGKNAATLDKFGIAAADLITCPTVADAREFNNCTMKKEICRCLPADAIVHCDCQTNTMLNQYFTEQPLPRKLKDHYIQMIDDKIVLLSDARVQLKVGLQKLKLSTVVDRNKCEAIVHSLTGCVNCQPGAMLNISCGTDFGTTDGHVECTTQSFPLKCSHPLTAQTVNLHLSHPIVAEKCKLRCSGHVSEFNIDAVLWKAPERDNWTPAKIQEVHAPSTALEIIHGFKDFFLTNYTYLFILIALFVILIIVLKLH